MIVREATPDDAEAIGRVHVESWRTTYRGLVSSEYLAGLDVGGRAAKWRGQIENAAIEGRVIFVVTDAKGDVLGFAAAGPARTQIGFDAELYAIYLMPGLERRGLGRAMFYEVVCALRRIGMQKLVVWVLNENPASEFYTALGGHFVREDPIEIGGAKLLQSGYGWVSFERIRRLRGKLVLDAYGDQKAAWPATGKHILAQFDDESVVVYQAFRASIADHAVERQRFGGDFSFTRMSWIKPNFLWMMFRSGWGTKQGQERVVAVRVRRDFFERALIHAVPKGKSDVRLQWDPDHDPSGNPVERRAIQLGLRGAMLREYASDAVIEILDVSSLVEEQRAHARSPHRDLMTPRERVFPIPK